MRNKIVFIVVVLFCISGSSWSEKTWTEVQKLSDQLTLTEPFSNSFEFSLWSSIRARTYRANPSATRVKSRYLQDPVRVAYKLYNRRVPVLRVYIPGIFNNIDEGQTKRAFNRMMQFKQNFVVLPNPWGTDYIKAKPSHKPGDLVSESDSLYSLILNFIEQQRLPEDTKIHLYGASYGGFLVSVIANLDAGLEISRVYPEVYSFSPPIDMKTAIANLDYLMFEDDFLNRKITGLDQAKIFLDYANAEKSRDLNPSSRMMAKDFVSRFGFKDPFRESLGLYFADKKTSGYVKDRIYYFSNYVNDLAPELRALLYSDLAKIDYWVQSAEKNYGVKVMVLSTKNDFLNSYLDYSAFDPEHYHFLENGGHLGFLEMPEYERILMTTK